MKNRILCIVGPTACGKTGLAVKLAARFGGEVVSADSMQAYRFMDIGTAKPTTEEREGVPHHMMDVCDPDEEYSVARYVEEACEVVDDILSRGRLPIVVGGTGLYVEALINGKAFSGESGDKALRGELNEYAAVHGRKALHEMLALHDPECAARIHVNDVKRVIRSLEIVKTTGMPVSAYNKSNLARKPRYDAAVISPDIQPRAELYAKIDARVDKMIDRGLADEVKGITGRFRLSPTAAQAIGYKEMFPYLDGKCTLGEATEAIKLNSRHYAKRQYTWFRRNPDIFLAAADGNNSQSILENSSTFVVNCGILNEETKFTRDWIGQDDE